MNINTIRASFKLLCVLLFSVLIFTGCMPKNMYKPEPIPEMSQLQWRTLQSKKFNTKNESFIHKAVVTALQDEGFIVHNYNKDIGLVAASVEYNQVDEETKMYRTANLQNGWQTIKKIDASVSISLVETNTYKVRVSLVQKGVSDTGGVLWSQPINTPEVYDNLFKKIGKSIFLQQEDL